MGTVAGLVVPFVVALAVAAALRGSTFARRLDDRPNERSLHRDPTPRVGGLALLAGALPVAAWHGTPTIAILLGCAVVLALVSWVDDLRGLPVEVRLPAHGVAAAVAVLAMAPPGTEPAWGALASVAAAIAIAWMTNLFNFMDGADGLAGGMAAIGFGTLAIVAWDAGATPLAWSAAALASASVGFLAFNLPPARVFMGDAGSIPLGFLAGALGALGAAESAWPWGFPAAVFSPFIVDATVTVLRRAARGRRIWRAHREHAYQRLVLGGWSKRRLAACAYALMFAVAASACWALRPGALARWVILFVWAAVYVLLLVAVERRHPMPGPSDRETPAGGFGP